MLPGWAYIPRWKPVRAFIDPFRGFRMVLNFHAGGTTQHRSIACRRIVSMTALGQISSPSDVRWSPLIPAPYTTRPLRSDRAAGKNGCVDRRCAVVARRNADAAFMQQSRSSEHRRRCARDGVVLRIDDAVFPGVSGGCSEHRHRCTEGRVCRGERRRRRPHRCCHGSSGGMPYLRTTMEQFGTTMVQFGTKTCTAASCLRRNGHAPQRERACAGEPAGSGYSPRYRDGDRRARRRFIRWLAWPPGAGH